MLRRSVCSLRIHSRNGNPLSAASSRLHDQPRKRVVCALGGNALKQPGQSGTLAEMINNALLAAPLLADIRNKMGYELCLTHGNGPQVGSIFLQNEIAQQKIPMMPLYVCGAESQGQLGYILQTSLETALNKEKKAGEARSVVAQLGTRVRVETSDPAFKKPTKPIGSFYSAEEAKRMSKEEGKVMIEDAGRGWRNVVPSPNPVEIVEAKAIRTLLDAGVTIVACGGGGIPVVHEPDHQTPLHGVDAVIDKDLAGERLACLVGATTFVILTDVDGVYLHHRDPQKRQLVKEATPQQLRQWASEGHFAAGSMGPKVDAVCRFVENNHDNVAYITSLEKVCDALLGKAGTCIRNSTQERSSHSPTANELHHHHASSSGDNTASGATSAWASQAEWAAPRCVLMHRPNDSNELNIPVIHPAAALFEKGFDPDDAARDHAGYIKMIEERGIKVLLLKDVLVEKAEHDEKWLSRLRNVAKASVVLDLRDIPEEDHESHRETVLSSIDLLSPRHVFDLIVNRPCIKPQATHINTGVQAKYEIQPEMNLFFSRDQVITTARGPVLANMNSTQRAAEVRLVALALEAMGTPAIFAVHGEGRLEGGDFIPAGEWAFQGQGLRTNQAAVKQLLEAGVYGSKFVCVVKDHWCDQEEMHLDTYFNIAGQSVCTLVETRFLAEPGSRHYLTCDIYEWNKTSYVLKAGDQPFVETLRVAGFKTIIPVPKADQLIYGCNYLTLGNKDILLVKREQGVSKAYREALDQAGVKYAEVEMSSLTKGYGAAHCTTQVARWPLAN